ncbi:unnamed protein product [Sympodiomycopsis kandeliae]
MSPHASSSTSRTSGTSSAHNAGVATLNHPIKRGSISGPSTSSNTVHSSSLLRRSKERHTPEHHPFRLEVQNVTPVCISFLWSVRPPPISEYRPSTSSFSNGVSHASKTASKDDNEWPSDDDGATAVEDDPSEKDDISEPSEAAHQSTNQHDIVSQSPHDADHRQGSTSVAKAAENSTPAISAQSVDRNRGFGRILANKTSDAGISVSVNGKLWDHVVLCDQGADEAIIVVYGLLPAKEYDILLSVDVNEGDEALPNKASLSARIMTHRQPESTSGSDSAGFATPERRDSIAPVSQPPSENGHGASEAADQNGARNQQQSEMSQAEARRDSLNATLRRNRKDASRSEQTLRNEIEGVKKLLERTVISDHRSKQKVLALQESIRQANQQAADFAEEAVAIEGEQSEWDEKATVAEEEEARERKAVEEKEAENKRLAEEDQRLTAEQEKSRTAFRKQLDSKRAEVEKLKSGRIAELESEMAKLHAEAERIRNSSTPPPPSLHQSASAMLHRPGGGLEPNAPPFHPSSATATNGFRSVSGPASGGSRGQQRGGRGGKNGPHHRNNPNQFHRRGRGAAGSGSSAASHSQFPQHHAPGHPGNLGFLPAHMAATGGGNTPSPSEGMTHGFGPQQPYSTLSPFAQPMQMPNTSDPHSNPSPLLAGPSGPFGMGSSTSAQHPTLSALNTSATDFMSPRSASASPVITKSHNISPIVPAVGTAAPPISAPWGIPSSSTTAPDYPAQYPYDSTVSGSRYPFTRGLPTVTTSSESPTLHHHQSTGSLFGFGGGPTGQLHSRRDSPTGAFFGSSGPSSLLSANQHNGRRGSHGPIDYRDDDAFDPTAGPLPSHHFGGNNAPGSHRTAFNSSLWSSRPVGSGAPSDLTSPVSAPNTTAASVAGGGGGGTTSSPWTHSSPLLDTFSAGHSVNGSSDSQIWSPQSSSRALGSGLSQGSHQYPSSILSSSGNYIGQFAPHRHNSGSSNSGTTNGNSLPTSPTSISAAPGASRLGSGSGTPFGAIGDEKSHSQSHSSLHSGPSEATSSSTAPVNEVIHQEEQ